MQGERARLGVGSTRRRGVDHLIRAAERHTLKGLGRRRQAATSSNTTSGIRAIPASNTPSSRPARTATPTSRSHVASPEHGRVGPWPMPAVRVARAMCVTWRPPPGVPSGAAPLRPRWRAARARPPAGGNRCRQFPAPLPRRASALEAASPSATAPGRREHRCHQQDQAGGRAATTPGRPRAPTRRARTRAAPAAAGPAASRRRGPGARAARRCGRPAGRAEPAARAARRRGPSGRPARGRPHHGRPAALRSGTDLGRAQRTARRRSRSRRRTPADAARSGR